MTIEKTLHTADDLLRLPADGCRYELLDGELIEMAPAGGRHNRILTEVAIALGTHVRARNAGAVFSGDTGIILRRNPDRVRAPDVCFIAADRLPPEGVPAGFLEIVPDLVVEIVSPGDSAAMVQQKIEEWLRASARLVWAIYPETRVVAVSRDPNVTRLYHDTETLDGEPMLPELSVPVATLFA